MSGATAQPAGVVERAGLADLVGLLAAGELSSVDLVAASLQRIDASQPTVNAFRRVCRDSALREAAQADRRLAVGERLLLLGVPIAIKDEVDVAGEPTAFGCAGDFPPAAADCEAVRRLRAAGAVIVGKTNAPELGQWAFTEGPAFGVTRNPWQLDHTPGGSSGGVGRGGRGRARAGSTRRRRGRFDPDSGGLDALGRAKDAARACWRRA